MSKSSSEYYIPDELYYFDERFSPRSLRRYQLKAILATYNISTPSHLSKTDLVKLYQEHVLSRKQEILRQYYENLGDDEDEEEEEEEEVNAQTRVLDEPRSTRQRTRSMRQSEKPATTMTWKTSVKRTAPTTAKSRTVESQVREEEDDEDEDEEFRVDPMEEEDEDDDDDTLEDDDISDTEAFMLLHDLQTPPDDIYGVKNKADPLATLQSYHPSFVRLLRGAYFLIAVLCMVSLAIVVHARSTNGYCDTATDDDHRLSLFSLPSACIPCPDHGVCEHGELQCQRLYERRRPFYNPFGLLPIADECIQDSAIGKTVAKLEKKIKRELMTEQGNLVCFRTVHGLTQTIGAEQIAQIKVEDIVTSIKEHEQFLLPSDTVDEVMAAALMSVLTSPHIFYWERDGKPYIGTDEPRFRMSCRARLAWYWLPPRYKTIVLAFLATLPVLLFGRYHYRYHVALKKNTEEKVKTMIEMLREQREKHAADPVKYPESGLTANQLRARVTSAHRPGALEEWKRLSKLLAMHMEIRKSFAETNGDPTEYWEITS
ncbi:Man1-Src1p-C-terminal domain-domain-containing protein [Syncephalastrum racemosum]|uniref:Man1-Src1p-C-terminal domain-domain-containing protein n=1 Tax=Syncephalastrum racemosum TaxID=13706 RepID=A0A1X2H0L1_SYNRA|nr:Man1-Src1p-C-terminal domain-domain-containing protein [Syncephalastrum racemosum]